MGTADGRGGFVMTRWNREGYQRDYQSPHQGGYRDATGYGASGRHPNTGHDTSGGYPNAGYGASGGYPNTGHDTSGGYPDTGYGASGGYPDAGYGASGRYPNTGYDTSGRYPNAGYDTSGGYPDADYRDAAGYPGGNYGYPQPRQDSFEDSRYDIREEMYDGDYGETGIESAGTANAFSAAGILKFAAAFLILVYIVLLLIYASGSTKPFEEVAQAVEGRLDTEVLVKQDAQALKRYYGLNGADYEGVLFYSAEFSISAEEVLLIEVRSEQQVQEVRDAIEDRLESRKHTFEGYAPEQAQLITQAQLQVRGRFVFLAVSAEAENYVSAFANGL